jgi:hypothetical protein
LSVGLEVHSKLTIWVAQNFPVVRSSKTVKVITFTILFIYLRPADKTLHIYHEKQGDSQPTTLPRAPDGLEYL